jgi:CubicO group peptidase (beta-lactamase class C family)
MNLPFCSTAMHDTRSIVVRFAMRVVAMSAIVVASSSAVAQSAVDPTALQNLIDGAKASRSDALVVIHDGKTVAEWTNDKPSRMIETMSVTKSVVSMAIGRLIDMGKIKSVDQPVHEFYPEWNQGKKKAITVRHLLNHTSGLQADANTREIYASPDFVQLALAAELANDPGTRFFYNNKATNLLAGLVKKASGERLDEFVREQFFSPMGIKEYRWSLDRAGNPHGQSGLQMHAQDLAKLGWLMANDGVWEGKRLLSSAWIRLSTSPGDGVAKELGLLWWLVPETFALIVDEAQIERAKTGGADAALLDQIKRMVGRYPSAQAMNAVVNGVFGSVEEMRKKLATVKIDRLSRSEFGPIVGFNANGWRGQYVVVLPKHKLVAVRLIESTPSYDDKTDGFTEFEALVKALVKP